LKAATSLEDFATLLGYSPAGLSYILYRQPPALKYRSFTIPKRSGEERLIFAPKPKLKLLQRRLADLLYAVLADIDKAGNPRKPLSHGFAKNLSIVTNAKNHKRKRFVLNFDLKNFFPSINFGRVRGVFINDRRFQFDPTIATLIAQVACHENALPQGSPCSPVISNIIGNLLDIRLVRFARAHKCTYSRYADDITFSTNAKHFPPEVAEPLSFLGDEWVVGANLEAEVSKAGFQINPGKTRMQLRGSRQQTTGLVVNEKPNICSEYYRSVRAMCSSLFNTGSYYRMVPAALSGGEPGEPDVRDQTTKLAPLQGLLGHIYHVRNQIDRRTSSEKKQKPTATRSLYQRFLFYRNFVVAPQPLVVPEGKTDSIYLRAAIERLSEYHPRLGSFEDGKFKQSVKFLNFSPAIHDVLQLGGGYGDLQFFVRQYRISLKRFRHRPLPNPVIVLVDNDSGGKQVFNAAKGLGIDGISLKSSDPFYRLTENLYLVKTPELGNEGTSCIENFFKPELFKEKINGKEFDPAKKHGAPDKYSKQVFAEKIVRAKKAEIDFSDFAPLLGRIVAVLDDYAANPTN